VIEDFYFDSMLI